APSWRVSLARPTSSLAVTMMTGTCSSSSRIRRRTWTPSSPGIRTSSRTRSARPPRIAVRASRPLPADSTAYPSVAKYSARTSRTGASSSTTRIRPRAITRYSAAGTRSSPQPPGVEPVDPACQHGHPVDLPRGLDEILGARAGEPPLELCQLLLERALLLQELLKPLGHLERSDLQEVGRLAERRFLPRHVLD